MPGSGARFAAGGNGLAVFTETSCFAPDEDGCVMPGMASCADEAVWLLAAARAKTENPHNKIVSWSRTREVGMDEITVETIVADEFTIDRSLLELNCLRKIG